MTNGRVQGVAVQNRQRKVRIAARQLRAAALAARDYAGTLEGELSVVVVGDRKMHELNRVFAGVDDTTDVLAFDLRGDSPPGGDQVAGEVVVNAALAARRVAPMGSTVTRELLLYVVHGVLHLSGYRDKTAPERRRMRAAERAVMRRLAQIPQNSMQAAQSPAQTQKRGGGRS